MIGYVVYGTRLLGSTDRVEIRGKSVFHVATKFFHINYLPLCPCGSYLVLDFLPGDRCAVVSIPLSCKSITLAWLRGISWATVLFSTIFLIADATYVDAIVFATALFVAPIVTWLQFFSDASYDRAIELLGYINGGTRFREGMERLIVVQYGQGNGDELGGFSIPTATAELVDDDNANDLEMQEEDMMPSLEEREPIAVAVAVAQPLKQQVESVDKMSGRGDSDNFMQIV